MTTFDEREEAFENRFMHDEELEFRAHARRNHKLGLWAAQRLGRVGDEAEVYAQALIAAEVEGGGGVLPERLRADFAAAGVALDEHEIQGRMDAFLAEARREVRAA